MKSQYDIIFGPWNFEFPQPHELIRGSYIKSYAKPYSPQVVVKKHECSGAGAFSVRGRKMLFQVA